MGRKPLQPLTNRSRQSLTGPLNSGHEEHAGAVVELVAGEVYLADK
jgi:hypothetical protein